MSSPIYNPNRPDWADMSDYVLHFSRGSQGTEAYSNIMAILSWGRIEARNPFGVGRARAPAGANHNMVCLSEVPFGQLGRLAARRRSNFAVAFRKSFLIEQGGNPILYGYAAGPLAAPINRLMVQGQGDPTHPIWQIVPFIDAPGAGGSYFFEWEREWRKVGHLSFRPEDVAFLVIPEDSHDAARAFFLDAEEDQVGPNYRCPFIDAQWSRERVTQVLAQSASVPLP
ncbi:hypothetical protein ABOZ73_15710 [Caulobacter sp. 73W]|uniref:Uncharacterized protein n=1 Tax=Caulobacter sp. 73W TaxID=3161137 RepID=A0AB39KRM0_9CAUL